MRYLLVGVILLLIATTATAEMTWQEELIMILQELETSYDEIEQGLLLVETGLNESEAASLEAEARLGDLEVSWQEYQTLTDSRITQLENRSTALLYACLGLIILTTISFLF